MKNVDMLTQTVERLVKEFGVDAGLAKEMLVGVKARLEHAISKGAVLNEALIMQATQHWFTSRQKMYEDLINNVDGCRDKLSDQVYNQIKSSN